MLRDHDDKAILPVLDVVDVVDAFSTVAGTTSRIVAAIHSLTGQWVVGWVGGLTLCGWVEGWMVGSFDVKNIAQCLYTIVVVIARGCWLCYEETTIWWYDCRFFLFALTFSFFLVAFIQHFLFILVFVVLCCFCYCYHYYLFTLFFVCPV